MRFRKILADGRREVGQSRCLDVGIKRFSNGDGWDVLQRVHQLEGHLSHLFQVLAAFSRVGAGFNRVEGLDHDVLGASSGELGVGLVWEDAGHQAVDILDNQRLASVFLLEGVDLDVVDGAGMDFISVALGWGDIKAVKLLNKHFLVTAISYLVRSMVAFKCGVGSTSLVCRFTERHQVKLDVVLQNLHRRVKLLGDEGLRVGAQRLVVNVNRGLKTCKYLVSLT